MSPVTVSEYGYFGMAGIHSAEHHFSEDVLRLARLTYIILK